MSSTENITDKRLKNLKEPWKKGQSGNSKGRKKGQRPYAAIYREALRKLAESQNLTPEEMENIIVQSGLKNALKDYRFYQDTLDRIHGKPKQGMELTGQDGEKLINENAIVTAILSALK